MPCGKVLSSSQSRHVWWLAAAAERLPSSAHDVIRGFERPVFGAGVCACGELIAFAKPHTHPYVAPGAVEWEQIGSTNFMT